MPKYVFGPVRSRRLGLSLGVNNIPYKHCSYSCIYCQLGATRSKVVERREFYDWREVAGEVVKAASRVEVDYVTFVPDGEPTLDANLGREIEFIKRECSVRVAVITNSSLLYREDVRGDLLNADLVSLKIDSCIASVYRRINRPHEKLVLEKVLEGIMLFTDEFDGVVLTETMLVEGVNTSVENAVATGEFIAKLKPSKAYVSVPVRPPCESWVRPPSPESLLEYYMVFKSKSRCSVEILSSLEPPPRDTGFMNPRDYILSTISVHPLNLEYARRILESKGYDADEVLKELVESGLVKIIDYGGSSFLVRVFKGKFLK